MEQIAFIFDNSILYWNCIMLALAAGVAVCVFLAFYLPRGSVAAAAAAIPAASVLSLLLGRLLHWYFCPDSYESLRTALTDYTSGGYALTGCFAACALTASLAKLLRLEKSALCMLDSMSIGGCAGIAVGRLACFFTAADRGQLMQKIISLPLAYPVKNVVTGAPEYRLATFVLQATATAVIFAALTAFSLKGAGRRDGDVTLLFLLLYGFSQAVLDSTRYDSLYLRSNGFIRVVQLLSAVAMTAAAILFSVRMVRQRGMRRWYIPLWAAMPALLGGAGYMEYFVQRHGGRALLGYCVMAACLGAFTVLSLLTYRLGTKST